MAWMKAGCYEYDWQFRRTRGCDRIVESVEILRTKGFEASYQANLNVQKDEDGGHIEVGWFWNV